MKNEYKWRVIVDGEKHLVAPARHPFRAQELEKICPGDVHIEHGQQYVCHLAQRAGLIHALGIDDE